MESARCKAFLAAVEAGSFSKAAEVLNFVKYAVDRLTC